MERKDWKVLKLGDFCDLKAGKNVKVSEIKQECDEINKYPCYGGNGIRGYIKKYSHCLIYPIIGRQGALCGNVTLAKAPFYATEHAVVVKPRSETNITWLYYKLRSLNLNQYAQGVAQPGLAVSTLNKIPIPFPPLPVQARIVDELDCLQGILSKKRQQLAEYHSLAQAIFHQMFGDPVVNEKGWEVKRLGEVCELKSGFAFKSSLFKTEGLPILRISNIQHDGISTNGLAFFAKEDYKEDLEKYRVLPGDTLIALSGATTGKVGYNKTHENFYLNQRVAICREKHLCNRHFIFFILKEMSKHILEMAGGAAQPNISTKQIGLLTIPIPPLPLQQSFANRIAVINNQCESLNKSIHEMETLLATRMDMLLNID